MCLEIEVKGTYLNWPVAVIRHSQLDPLSAFIDDDLCVLLRNDCTRHFIVCILRYVDFWEEDI